VKIVDLRDNVSEVVPPDVLAQERRRVREFASRVDPMGLTRWVRVNSACLVRHEGRGHIQ